MGEREDDKAAPGIGNSFARQQPAMGEREDAINEQRARELLAGDITSEGLYNLGWYLSWHEGDDSAVLDGRFTAEELEAIAWGMRNFVALRSDKGEG